MALVLASLVRSPARTDYADLVVSSRPSPSRERVWVRGTFPPTLWLLLRRQQRRPSSKPSPRGRRLSSSLGCAQAARSALARQGRPKGR